MTHTMVIGTTEPQDFQLLDDGAVLVGTGLDVAIEFRTAGLTAAQLAATATSAISVAWLAQATGTVRVTGMEGLPLGTYYFRFTLEDLTGDIGYVPNEATSDEWRVVRI